ncbi:Lrp/AsnC family transcriptional regulator [Candidatus Woesearchaeota archaeon]|nr:Lrp/AsnC family transcriptional regulator [Candidatus Woesearchaeota archaeon]
MAIDEIDQKIILTLQEQGRWSTQKISRKTGIPITTVHHRIKKMEERRIIKGYTVILNHQLMGNQVLAYVLLKGDINYLREKNISPLEIIHNLQKKGFVEEIDSTTGHYDYIIKIRVKNMSELSKILVNHIRRIPGIGSTETLLVLDEEGKFN